MPAVVVRAVVKPSCYRDSLALMRVAERLRTHPGVREVAALMGSPANRDVLAAAGLATPDLAGAGPSDLILAVAAEDPDTAQAALDAGEAMLTERVRPRGIAGESPPRTLDRGLSLLAEANLAVISVPGAFARREALRALHRGLHVFLFSDNVPLPDEVELKRVAVHLGLLCMGPDCGTAYIGGVGLGFANAVARGRVGCVAASGTGLQAVACQLDALGEGISHALGVGGRDLSSEVGGAMTWLALDALAADADTEFIAVISKPPAPDVRPALEAAVIRTGKPAVVCYPGARPGTSGRITWVATLEDAAETAAAALRGHRHTPRAFGDPVGARARLERLAADRRRGGGGLLGLYTGGTLAAEARAILEPLVGPTETRLDPGAQSGHRVVDLGDDAFTVGRPHPMLDPELRAARLREHGAAADVGVLLVDLVLGRGVHDDPATPLAAAVRDVRRRAEADGRSLVAVASVVGTARDPQGLARQVATLEAAGIEVLPSNAQAARFAALAFEPSLWSRLGA
jgi:FdrA protein